MGEGKTSPFLFLGHVFISFECLVFSSARFTLWVLRPAIITGEERVLLIFFNRQRKKIFTFSVALECSGVTTGGKAIDHTAKLVSTESIALERRLK